MQQVRLMLPEACCNLKCAYCLNSNNILGGKTRLDFKKVFELIDMSGCNLISVWGGEPLCNPNLSWLLKKLRWVYPEKQISLLTNGTCLNKNYVKLFNELNIHVGISHDGPAQYLRCEDFLTDNYIELLKTLKHFTGFNCVVSRKNCDLKATYDFFVSRCKEIGGDWQLTFEMFELTQPEILDHMPSVEEYELLKENYVAIMELANEGRPYLESMKQRLRSRNPTGLSCGADQRLTIDCAGNIYHCQVTAERNDARRVQASVPLMCADCRYVSDCRGICPVMPDSLRKKLCLCHYVYYDAKRTAKEVQNAKN